LGPPLVIPAGDAYFSAHVNNHSPVPVGVFGASGYVGQELLRLLAGHPGASLVFATAESAAGQEIEGHRLLKADDAPLNRAELVLSALPHGVSASYVQRARAAGKRTVDLSADFRLSPEAVYGLTEVTRPRIAAAELVANPGCYPTAALLALIPLAQQGLIDTSREVVIDAASGVTGAGRAPKRELLFGEVAEDFRAYAVGNEHRHLPELKATLARESGFTGDVVFTPHLLPVKRGILETIHVPLTRVLDRATAERLYHTVYAEEPCVVVMHGTLPSLKDVVYRNRVAIGVAPVANVRRPRLTVIAAIDNLVKGAAGQAVQNMNVMLGLPETLGLAC
jgi:N-acetyl-gamma-glutamyl-phosphate reductase